MLTPSKPLATCYKVCVRLHNLSSAGLGLIDLSQNGYGLFPLFVFASHHAGRPQALVERLDRWARFLRPHARLYLCDPLLCEPVLAEFGLAPTHAPTAVAYDTEAAREGAVECRWRMADLYGAAGPPRQPQLQVAHGGGVAAPAAGLDVAMLTKFVVAVCQLRTPLGSGAAQLALL